MEEDADEVEVEVEVEVVEAGVAVATLPTKALGMVQKTLRFCTLSANRM